MNRSTVSNMMRLLELPETVQTAVRQDRISGGHAQGFAAAVDRSRSSELARQIEQKKMSVRQDEEAVRRILKTGVVAAAGLTQSRRKTWQASSHGISIQCWDRRTSCGKSWRRRSTFV